MNPADLRIGIGHDTHRLGPGGPLLLGGIAIEFDRHLEGHSDADVLLHAVTDALLGAAAAGDIGELFPDTDPNNRGRDSAEMLKLAFQQVRQSGYDLQNLDCIIFAQAPKLSPYKLAIRQRIADILGVDADRVSVKAKTGEGIGAIGRGEALAAQCVALLTRRTWRLDTSSTEGRSAMTIRVYNTLTRRKETFEPVDPPRVGIYLCGPTVYDRAHIGHMVGPVIFDTIKRYLTYCGYDVTWVVNITDVDDKLIAKANERGLSMAEVARENTADYLHNLAALGVDQIDHMPKATETMPEIIAFVEALIAAGYAYEADGDVFFDVGRDAEYGKLTNRTIDSLQGEGGGAAAKKRSPADFALWKQAKAGEPSWDSPWGQGRPGWHIECSAMSRHLLGKTFDIHGGGLDLIFPHHENEIAQSECCHGQAMARYWMHNGLLKRSAAGKVGGRAERAAATDAGNPLTLEQIQQATAQKESRSAGAGGLAEMIAQLGGEQIRFFLVRTHYRSTVLFSDEALAESHTALEAFYRLFERYERITGQSFYDLPAATRRADGEFQPGDDPLLQAIHRTRDAFLQKMDDDFNTGAAASDLFELTRLLNKFIDQQQLEDPQHRTPVDTQRLKRGASSLRELTTLLGLFLKPPRQPAQSADDNLAEQLIALLISLRTAARQSNDFSTADRIRAELATLGVVLEDRKGGTGWRRQA